MPSFGISATDGTIALCRAKPENRGRGNCFHGEHVELEGAMAAPSVVNAYNEEKLAEHFGGQAVQSHKKVTVPSPGGGRNLTPQEFDRAAESLSDSFSQEHWELLNSFYSKFSSIVGEDPLLAEARDEAVDRVYSFIQSDDEEAKNVREFLGPEIDLKTFSSILVHQVNGMVARIPLQDKARSYMARVVMTNVDNDMTKRRYVASVLYFGGRCCYCNKPMNRTVGSPEQATGEHITPIRPDHNKGPIGATRYGNMALACYGCNHERENTELQQWLNETKRLNPEEKTAAAQRIRDFRRFALYEEYTPQQSKKLRQAISALEGEWKAADKDEKLRPTPEALASVNQALKAKLYDLRNELNF